MNKLNFCIVSSIYVQLRLRSSVAATVDPPVIYCSNCIEWYDGCNGCWCGWERWDNNSWEQSGLCTLLWCTHYNNSKCYQCIGSSVDVTNIDSSSISTSVNDLNSLVDNFDWNIPIDTCFAFQTNESSFSFKFNCDFLNSYEVSLEYFDGNDSCLGTGVINSIDLNSSNINANCDGYSACSVTAQLGLVQDLNDCTNFNDYLIVGFASNVCNKYNDSWWYSLNCNTSTSVEFNIYSNKYCVEDYGSDYSYVKQWVNVESVILKQYQSLIDQYNLVVCHDVDILSCVSSFEKIRDDQAVTVAYGLIGKVTLLLVLVCLVSLNTL